MDARRLKLSVFLLACGLPLAGASEAMGAEERGKKRRPRKVSAWGQLGERVDGSSFFEITYYRPVGKDGKAKVKKAKGFLKLTPKTFVYQDARVPIDALKPEEDVRIFGKPVSTRVPNRGAGLRGVDSQIQNARVVLGGDLDGRLPFDKDFKDPTAPGHGWLEGKVTKSAGGLWVDALGVAYRVTLEKGSPVLKRVRIAPETRSEKQSEKNAEKGPEDVRDRLKRGLYVQFFAWTTGERPETGRKSDADADSFRAAMIVILDRPSLATVYPLMWKR